MTDQPPIMAQGTRANYTGNELEGIIEYTLKRKGYAFIPRKDFKVAELLDQPVFTRQFPLGKGIYGNNLNCDFILFHPQKHPSCLIIESKWQEKAGSVDEKFPFLVQNVREKYPYATIIVLDGGGYKKGAEEWLRKQTGPKLLRVFNMMEFQKWANGDGV